MRWPKSGLVGASLLAAVIGCGGDMAPTSVTSDPPPPPPPPQVLLKDVVVSNLPAPYYHFAYDASGRIDSVSFASELTRYEVQYLGGRIRQLQNDILVNHDRLVYAYDADGRVGGIRYVDATGATYAAVVFTYEGDRLVGLERHRLTGGQDVLEKTMSMTYWLDGNLRDLTEHRSAIAGVQDDQTYVDHYDLYDDGINVDAFGLLHDDFFDHLVLLPDVRLQRNNPRRLTRTGDGINFAADFSYTYDALGRPTMKSGLVSVVGGPQGIATSSTYSYY